MIEFTTNTIKNIDIELSKFDSIPDLSMELEHVIDGKSPNSSITVALIPPLSPNVSIPNAFKELMAFLGQFKEKQLSLLCQIKSEEIIDHLIKFMPPEMVPSSRYSFGNISLLICVADIIEVKIDAIVNASNPDLKLGGGVSGSIRNKANSDAQLVLDRIASSKKLKDGEAVLTDGLGLKGIRYIIHVASVRGTSEVVRKSIESVIDLCEKNSIKSVAIPALGTGTGGLPVDEFANLFKDVFMNRITMLHSLREVVIALWQKTDYDTFVREFVK